MSGLLRSSLALSLLVLSLAQGCGHASLRLATTVWPPFTDERHEPRVANEIVDGALIRAGYGATTSVIEASALATELATGPYDGSAALWRTSEREAVLLYSEPYLENRLILVAPTGGDVSATSVAALAGQRVCLVEGYAYGDAIEGVEGPLWQRRADTAACFHALLAGEADYLVEDELVVHLVLTHYAEAARERLVAGTTPLAVRTLHLALRRDLADAAVILARFDEAVRAMIADGTYNRILGIDWLRHDVDGDGTYEIVARDRRAGAAAPDTLYHLMQPTATASGSGAVYVDGVRYDGPEHVPPGESSSETRTPTSVPVIHF